MSDWQLRALTVRQPAAQHIALGDKPIENRSWLPPQWLVGHTFLIHADKSCDRKEAQLMEAAQ